MAQELVLIRHCDIGDRYRGRFVGSTDLPLCDEGLKQACTLAVPASAYVSAKVFCSPMLRARQTADALGVAYEVDSSLREVCFGVWECKTFEEIVSSHPGKVDDWAAYSADFAFPEGESIASFTERARDFGGRAASESVETVVAVTHGGIIRALICHFLGLDMKNYLLFDVKPASISKIAIYDGGGVLTQLNDLCHLEGIANG